MKLDEILAETQGDQAKVTETTDLHPESSFHLRSAKKTLTERVQRALVDSPDSDLANLLSEMLKHERLYEIVGPWPVDKPAAGGSQGGSAVPTKVCRHCGQPNP